MKHNYQTVLNVNGHKEIMIAKQIYGWKPKMTQRTDKFDSLRVLVTKEVYNIFKVYVIQNNTSVSEMVMNYIDSVVSNEPVYFR